MVEETLLILKPDAVLRRFVSVEVLKILLLKEFKLMAFKEILVSADLAEKHYLVHSGKPFYDWLIRFITSGPVIAMRVEGRDVIQEMRRILGSTFAHKAEAGTLRGKYGIYGGVNVAHASDSDKTAQEELRLWVEEADLVRSRKISVAKKIDAYIKFHERKRLTDQTRILRSTCINIVEGKISETRGREVFQKTLDAELQDADRKYSGEFCSAVIETCMMDRAKT